nr:penicillin acylase family protein [Leifsonia sp. C5G2]
MAVLLALVVAVGGLGVWTVARSLPQTSGRLDLPSLSNPVTVHRDDAGVPQLSGSTPDDVFRAQGFVHAQDRFWEMDFRRHLTAGRLSEMFGERLVDTDVFIRTLGWRKVAEEEVKLLDPTSLRYYRAYADGVNAYLKQRTGLGLSLEYAVLGLQNPSYQPKPWTPADSIAWLKAMAWDLLSSLGAETNRALLATKLTPDLVDELYPEYPYDDHPTVTDQGEGDSAAPADPLRPSAAVDRAAPKDVGDVLPVLAELLTPREGEIGSNSWVVSGAHTTSGKPLLANDPHLGAAMPSVWYQMGLRCTQVNDSCPFDVSGFTFAGLPGVVIGHNDRISWGFTNLAPDVSDLFLEKVTGGAYEYAGEQVSLTSRTERIRVAGGEDVTITVRSTRHGPIISDHGGPYATIAEDSAEKLGLPADGVAVSLAWTGSTPGTGASATFALNVARDWESFRDAAKLFDVPSQNLIYADVEGHIGYQAPGRIPVRAEGDGRAPVPGWTGRYDWTGAIPFEQLPAVYDPPSGFVVTANNPVVGPEHPQLIARDWDYGYRADQIDARLTEFIVSGRKIDSADMSSIQLDTYDANAATLVPVLSRIADGPDAASGVRNAARLLEDWDFHDDADSAEAAYFAVFWSELLKQSFGRKLPDDAQPSGGSRWFSVVERLLDQPDSAWWDDAELGIHGRDRMISHAAERAWDTSKRLMGDDPEDWQWGRLHTLTLVHPALGRSGISAAEWLFNRGAWPVSGGTSVVNATAWDAAAGFGADLVPSMRMVVDLDDFDRSTWINLTGASGHAFDPHYADQTELWALGESRPWPFSPTAVKRAADRTLTLRPSG